MLSQDQMLKLYERTALDWPNGRDYGAPALDMCTNGTYRYNRLGQCFAEDKLRRRALADTDFASGAFAFPEAAAPRIAVLMRGEAFRETHTRGDRNSCNPASLSKQVFLLQEQLDLFAFFEAELGLRVDLFGVSRHCTAYAAGATDEGLLLAHWFRRYLRMPVAVLAEGREGHIKSYMQDRSEITVVLLMKRYLAIQKCAVQYAHVLMLRWDLQAHPSRTNFPHCLLDSPVPLNEIDLNGGGTDPDMSTLIPAAVIPLWVCLIEVSRGQDDPRNDARTRWCGWDVCTDQVKFTDAGDAFKHPHALAPAYREFRDHCHVANSWRNHPLWGDKLRYTPNATFAELRPAARDALGAADAEAAAALPTDPAALWERLVAPLRAGGGRDGVLCAPLPCAQLDRRHFDAAAQHRREVEREDPRERAQRLGREAKAAADRRKWEEEGRVAELQRAARDAAEAAGNAEQEKGQAARREADRARNEARARDETAIRGARRRSASRP